MSFIVHSSLSGVLVLLWDVVHHALSLLLIGLERSLMVAVSLQRIPGSPLNNLAQRSPRLGPTLILFERSPLRGAQEC
jgi:hypothetical protein